MTTDALGNYVPYTQKLDDGIGLVMASVSIPLFHWGEGLKRSRRHGWTCRTHSLTCNATPDC